MPFRFLILSWLLLCGSVSASLAQQSPRRLSYEGWGLVFADEFDTYTSIDDMEARSPWRFTPGEHPTLVGNKDEDEYYDRGALSLLPEGRLVITATRLPDSLVYRYQHQGRDTTKVLHYRSGWLSLKSDFWSVQRRGDPGHWEGNRGFQYGLFEIRCKLADAHGTWPAFWLYSGPNEIDVLEAGTDENNAMRKYSNNVHVNSGPSAPSSAPATFHKTFGASLARRFHTYSVIWTPTEVTFYFNGRRLRTVPASAFPTSATPADIIVNQAVVSYADPGLWPWGPNRQPQARMEIDYIRVYKPLDGSFSFGQYPFLPAPPADN